jgi:hypothetical protein
MTKLKGKKKPPNINAKRIYYVMEWNMLNSYVLDDDIIKHKNAKIIFKTNVCQIAYWLH